MEWFFTTEHTHIVELLNIVDCLQYLHRFFALNTAKLCHVRVPSGR